MMTHIKSHRKSIIIIIITILAIATIVASYKMFFQKEIFHEESREKEIKEEKKQDNTGIHTVGWLKVQGSNIDLPVIYYGEAFYKDIKKQKYVWTTNYNEKVINRVTIYGHNILNLSSNPKINIPKTTSFEDLMSFIYPEYIDKNKYIQYSIDDKNYIYKIFSVRLLKDYKQSALFNKEDLSKKKFKNYLKEINKDNLYKTSVKVNEDDKIITLVTCTRFFGADKRNATIIVDGKLVKPNEKLTNYTVEQTDNYKKIKKYMIGDEVDV